jgi:hypothetical protein
LQEATNGVVSESHLPTFVLNGCITKDGLQYLIDYAYTGDLEVPDESIKDVYLAAWKLKMDNVVKEAAGHLIKDLEAETCIEIRSLPGISRNQTFVQAVDNFIQKEVLPLWRPHDKLNHDLYVFSFPFCFTCSSWKCQGPRASCNCRWFRLKCSIKRSKKCP